MFVFQQQQKELISWQIDLVRLLWQVDLMRVDLVAFDLVRIDLVTPSRIAHTRVLSTL